MSFEDMNQVNMIEFETQIRIVNGKMPFIMAEISGKKLPVFLDTGVSSNLIFPDNIGIGRRVLGGDISSWFTMGSKVTSKVVEVSSLKIEKYEYKNVICYAHTMKNKTWEYGDTVKLQPEGIGPSLVILGLGLFRDRIFYLDLKRNVFRVYRKNITIDSIKTRNFQIFKMLDNSKLIKIVGLINGIKKEFIIDSGNVEDFMVFLNEKSENREYNWELCGVKGKSKAVSSMGWRYDNTYENKSSDVIIGREFLKRNALFIDLKSRVLSIEL